MKTISIRSVFLAAALICVAHQGGAQTESGLAPGAPSEGPAGRGAFRERAAHTTIDASPGKNSAYAYAADIPTTLIPDPVTGPNCANSAQTLLSVTEERRAKPRTSSPFKAPCRTPSPQAAPHGRKANRGITVNGFLDVVATKYSRSSAFAYRTRRDSRIVNSRRTWWVDLDV